MKHGVKTTMKPEKERSLRKYVNKSGNEILKSINVHVKILHVKIKVHLKIYYIKKLFYLNNSIQKV